MIATLVNYFKTGPVAPLLLDPAAIRRFYERKRWSIFLSLIFGYANLFLGFIVLSIVLAECAWNVRARE